MYTLIERVHTIMNIDIKEASAGGEQILAKLHTEDGLNEESLADLANFTKKDFDGIALGKRTIWFAYSSEEPVGDCTAAASFQTARF